MAELADAPALGAGTARCVGSSPSVRTNETHMKTIGYLYAISAAVLWGLVYMVDQKVLTKVSPLALLFLNAALITVLSLPLLFFLRTSVMRDVIVSGRENIGFVFLSVCLTILANLAIFSAIKILGAPTATIFEIAYPFFVILFTVLFFQAELNAFFFLGALLIFVGSFVIIRLA